MSNKKSERIQLRASESDVTKLIDLANILNISKSEAIRCALYRLYDAVFKQN